MPPHAAPASRSSTASWTPVDAPDGTAARPTAPESEPDPRVAAELGDVLFAAVNVARHVNVDPELALRWISDRFVARVERAERLAADDGREWVSLPLEEQDRYFDRAKVAFG